jgi:hypothetical protein
MRCSPFGLIAVLASAACTGRLEAQSGIRKMACAVDSAWNPLTPQAPTYDERIAFRLPEYAGVSRDTGLQSASSRIVRLTDLRVAPTAEIVVRAEVRDEGHGAQRTRFVQVTYSYRELRSWLECYLRDAGIRNLTTWTVSVRRNRVGLGVAADSIRAKVLEDIQRLGLPVEAFDVQVEVIRVGAVWPLSNEEL